MYGKLQDGNLIIAPKKISHGESLIYNPPESLYLLSGYFPVRLTDPPDEPSGYYCECSWEQGEKEIIQTWTVKPLPVEAEDIINILLGVSE